MDFRNFVPSFSANRDSGENLKKVLALVLAFACAFTMFAGAAFTDQADIKVDADVVDTLVSLGIIEGFEDGSFQPNATVTRAQMAKMIYVLRTGNSDASAYNDDYTSFTDINGHWARGYIKYCQSLGIIAGKSATVFAPNASVTAQEAAKMLLVTLGYNAEKAGLTGAGWAAKTNALADEAGLLEDVNTSFTAACPRQYAAQLIYNAIDANTVVLRDGEYTDQTAMGVDNKTVGEKYMGLKKTVGTLASFAKTSGKDTYELTINPVNYDESSSSPLSAFTKVKKDYSSMKYNTVKVLYKAKDDVYGVFATDDNTVQTGVLADLKMDGSKVKLNDTKYDLAKVNNVEKTTVYVDGQKVQNNGNDVTISAWVTANAEGNSTYEKGSTVKLSATDGSSNYSVLEVTTYAVKKVTFVGSDYVTAGTKYEEDDYNIDSEIKKDDYAVISAKENYADDKGVVAKATTVEGKITSTKTTSVTVNGTTTSKINKVAIDGTWYETNAAKIGASALKLGNKVKLVLVNGFIYEVDNITAGTTDVALLVEMGNSNTVGSKYYQARMIFADGTDKVVDIEKEDGNDAAFSSANFAQYSNMLCTYDESKGVYTLTLINGNTAATDLAGYENFYYTKSAIVDGSIRNNDGTYYSNASANADQHVSRAYFYDNATVFVKYKTDEYKVVTGKSVKDWDSTTVSGTGTTVRLLTEKDKNSQYVGAAFIDLGSRNNTPGGSDKTYAVALDSSYTDKIDGTTYTIVKAWNGTEEKEYKYEGTISGGIAKGAVFEYSADGEDTVDIDVVNTVDTQVKTYDEGSGEITFSAASIANLTSSNSKIDSKDTVVLYVDSDKAVGETDGEIQLAPEFNGDGNNHDNNVSVYVDQGDDQITVIVVDVKNKLDW